MSAKSPWHWGVLYHAPEDERLWVPKRTGLGWTVNLGHPKAANALLLLVSAGILVPLLGCMAWRWRLLAASPVTTAWPFVSIGLAFLAYGWNPDAWSTRRGMLTGLVFGAQLLYPDTAQYDLYTEVAEYFKLFYHCDLTQAQYDALVANSIGAQQALKPAA